MEDADADALEKTKNHQRKIKILHQGKTENLPQKAIKEEKALQEAIQKKALQEALKKALLEEDKLIKMIKKYSTMVFLVKKLILL